MKLALAQINPTVGDLSGNRDRILSAYGKAAAAGADLVAFPELAVTGYPPRDLLEDRRFVARNVEVLNAIAARATGPAAVIGFVEPNPERRGRPCFNAAAFAAGGKVVSVFRKRLLPVYDVFDETRYFEPGSAVPAPVAWAGGRISVTICEDLWSDEPVGGGGRRLYREDPIGEAARGSDLVLNLSASPFSLGRERARLALVSRHARRLSVALALVNQVGGNDELVFDGSSLACGADGRLLASAASFREDLAVCDLSAPAGAGEPAALSDPEALAGALTLGLADYARKCGFSQACLGLSGGVDSAVTAVLAARALGPANVLGVLMPSRYTSRASVEDAEALAGTLGIATETIPIEPVFRAYLETLAPAFRGAPASVAEENLQARVRGAMLMALSNKRGYLLLSTGNKSEISMGYCTLYGDLCGGLAAISDVPKTLVWELARWMNRAGEIIPLRTITRAPTAELRENQKDADSLPDYATLDPILRGYVEEGKSPAEIASETGSPEPLVRWIVRQVQAAEYKRRQIPPGLRVTSKAFGMGRRMPIANRWDGEEGQGGQGGQERF